MSTTENQLKRLENKLHNSCSFYINTGGVVVSYFETAIKLVSDKKVSLNKIEEAMKIYCESNKCEMVRIDDGILVLALSETSAQKTALAEVGAQIIGEALVDMMKEVVVKKEKFLQSLINLNEFKKAEKAEVAQ